jgi:hypothetical protein
MSALQELYRTMVGPASACAPMFTSSSILVEDSCIEPCVATAGIYINADGTIRSFIGGEPAVLDSRWDGGCGILDRADYDFRFDCTFGFCNLISSDIDGVWVPGTALITFGVTKNIGIFEAIGTLRIRPTGGGVDIDTVPLHLTAETFF